MLFNIDGFDKNWEIGTSSNWKLFNDSQVDTPFANSKLNRNFTTDELMNMQPKVDSKMEECKKNLSKKYNKYTVGS